MTKTIPVIKATEEPKPIKHTKLSKGIKYPWLAYFVGEDEFEYFVGCFISEQEAYEALVLRDRVEKSRIVHLLIAPLEYDDNRLTATEAVVKAERDGK